MTQPTRARTGLSVEPDQPDWQPAQDALLGELISDWDQCPHTHRIRFLHACQSSGLDPFLRQIFTARGRDGDWYIQAHLDGLRIAAQRAADQAGEMYEVEEPVWIAGDGARHPGVWTGSSAHPHAVLCAIVKIRGAARARVACDAYWDEYCPTQMDPDTGELTEDEFWLKHPMMRLGQVVESAGLRKAYPGALSAIFLPAEATAIARATAARVAAETLEHVAEQSAAAMAAAAAQQQAEAPAETPDQVSALREVVRGLLARAEGLGFGERIRVGMQQVYGSSDPATLTLEQLAHIAEQAQAVLNAGPLPTPATTPPAGAAPADSPAKPARRRTAAKKTAVPRARKKPTAAALEPAVEADADSGDGGTTKPTVTAKRQPRRAASRKADAS